MIFSMSSPDPQRINCDDLVTSWLKNIKPHSSSIIITYVYMQVSKKHISIWNTDERNHLGGAVWALLLSNSKAQTQIKQI